MRHLAWLIALLLLSGLLQAAGAFEETWTDQFGETTYRITGPDIVGVADSVRIVLTASDPAYPDNMVASPWRFLVDGAEFDGGFSIILDGTEWILEHAFVYDLPGAHDYIFRAQDLGQGGGAHSWEWFEISGNTIVEPPTDGTVATWGAIRAIFR